MFKTLTIAAAALTVMSAAGFAQSSSSTSTTVIAPGVAPTHDVDITTTTRRTAGRNGETIEKDTDGTETSTPGSPAISRTKTETTTIR
jgi:hypothetical protein